MDSDASLYGIPVRRSGATSSIVILNIIFVYAANKSKPKCAEDDGGGKAQARAVIVGREIRVLNEGRLKIIDSIKILR
jgi:hypothetical protein